ncbi:50S ribosomal protein L2 [Candidatus Roizmanbacteria bacterium RIFCSPLOWO2_01_FULL_38_12]|uniref:Large ribosomal subunit protein uL2 n=1 Tax=Candidatus Roizmanbacteria bacterium RIFCSPLOWO2_01_FULL_38_12 TaxID=1802061 RepID=A0A1F7IXZ5_9BACT|nr:MAG: 50S ribosomal protein L2 [Candidatus Roizmanbacteria bacterium RIFCSPHIGHO2_01_FULL_38_15]OGK35902.1 MAG: 50S ribosomal protein L2 [Candidatus Roizmanbacteria bacterium RIFCSPHIGHO2_12_FULL_38_13]OGK48233.1 MAG: 50S ribosomal protein L2 [Candidatus Roizmanbacteria bacterium RIFCSPLOWO2_01_FULL_38_12]
MQIPKTQNPQKGLIKILKKHSGRDSSGKITVRHQGKRQKRYYRLIDFKRDKRDIVATVNHLEFDPNRNAFIALVTYEDKEKRYILAPTNLQIGDKVVSKEKAEIKIGNALQLKNIPVGVEVHNIEMYPGQGGMMTRGAGTFATVIAKEGPYVHIKLSSGEVRRFQSECFATVGRVSNITHKDEVIGRAGRSRLMGIRPTVRGTAQNPRTHPHGGGEGRSGEGMHPKTPWGKPARGKKTRKPNKWSSKLIVSSRS